MVTQEPRGLNWINNLNRETFGSIVSQICWLVGSFAFTYVTCRLLLDEGVKSDAHHGIGIQLATALLFAWTGKSIAGVVDANNKRKAHPDYAPVAEAKERGKLAGAAAAVALQERAADAKATREYVAPVAAVVPPATEVTVNVPADYKAPEIRKVPVIPVGGSDRREGSRQTDPPSEDHQWATGKPDEGLL